MSDRVIVMRSKDDHIDRTFVGTFSFKCPYCGWKLEDQGISRLAESRSRIRLDVESCTVHLIKDHYDLSSGYIARLKIWWDAAYNGTIPFYGYFYSYVHYIRSKVRAKLRTQGALKRRKHSSPRKPAILKRYKKYLEEHAPGVLADFSCLEKMPDADAAFEIAKQEFNFLVENVISNKASTFTSLSPIANVFRQPRPFKQEFVAPVVAVPTFPAVAYSKDHSLVFQSNWSDSLAPHIVPQILEYVTSDGVVRCVQYNFILDVPDVARKPFNLDYNGSYLRNFRLASYASKTGKMEL